MAKPIREHFVASMEEEKQIVVSPALANLFATPALASKSEPLKVDTLEREKDLKKATEKACPKCPVCPDMSQYIRLDEIPCWNCSLP